MTKNFPIAPIVKITHFGNIISIYVTKASNFYNGGLTGNFSFFVGSSWNFVSGYIKKCWHTSWQFWLEIRSNKKVIAKKCLTNLYEMNRHSGAFTCVQAHELTKLVAVLWELCPGFVLSDNGPSQSSSRYGPNGRKGFIPLLSLTSKYCLTA